MEFFNPVQKVGWTAGQPLIQVKNEGGVNQQFDFTPLANQLANQQAAASNFHNIVGAAQFPIGSFAGAQAGQAERVGFPKQAVATVKQNGKLKGGAKTVDNKKDKNSTRKWSPNRKAAGFWSPFNDWWRLEFERLGRRPTTEEVSAWYVDHADRVWGDAKPSMQSVVARSLVKKALGTCFARTGACSCTAPSTSTTSSLPIATGSSTRA